MKIALDDQGYPWKGLLSLDGNPIGWESPRWEISPRWESPLMGILIHHRLFSAFCQVCWSAPTYIYSWMERGNNKSDTASTKNLESYLNSFSMHLPLDGNTSAHNWKFMTLSHGEFNSFPYSWIIRVHGMIKHPIVKVHCLSVGNFSWRKWLEFIYFSNKPCNIYFGKQDNSQLKLFIIIIINYWYTILQ